MREIKTLNTLNVNKFYARSAIGREFFLQNL